MCLIDDKNRWWSPLLDSVLDKASRLQQAHDTICNASSKRLLGTTSVATKTTPSQCTWKLVRQCCRYLTLSIFISFPFLFLSCYIGSLHRCTDKLRWRTQHHFITRKSIPHSLRKLWSVDHSLESDASVSQTKQLLDFIPHVSLCYFLANNIRLLKILNGGLAQHDRNENNRCGGIVSQFNCIHLCFVSIGSAASFFLGCLSFYRLKDNSVVDLSMRK